MTLDLGIELGPQWWEGSDLTAALSLHPNALTFKQWINQNHWDLLPH